MEHSISAFLRHFSKIWCKSGVITCNFGCSNFHIPCISGLFRAFYLSRFLRVGTVKMSVIATLHNSAIPCIFALPIFRPIPLLSINLQQSSGNWYKNGTKMVQDWYKIFLALQYTFTPFESLQAVPLLPC